MGTEVLNEPPRPSQSGSMRAPVILDEDDWTEALELIIERDYFPDIPKMQNKLEWLQVRANASSLSCQEISQMDVVDICSMGMPDS